MNIQTTHPVFLLGDSISIQYLPHLEKMVRPSIAFEGKLGLGTALKNLDQPAGANGGTSALVLTYLQERVKQPWTAKHMLLNCGLHDIRREIDEGGAIQTSEEVYRENLRKVFDLVAAIPCALTWVRTTPAFEEIHNSRTRAFHRFREDNLRYNEIADEVCAEKGVPSLDLHGFTMTLGNKEALFRDHVHYPEEIQQLQAAYIAGYLKAWIRD